MGLTVRIKATPSFNGTVLGVALVSRCQPTACQGVESVEGDVIAAEAGQ
jgi:putative component of membrane protein insertase Oxa1/YidC/SpoIIIJ protein YidD